MNMTRNLILIIASFSLGGCITYPDGGYYSSPDVNSYYGDGYYGNNDDYYDDGYNGNYGQYEYYGSQPSITFNFFNYGYSNYYPNLGYSNYYNYRPCNSWSSYCYAYRPSYGWGYWPVYVYRPTIHHHHYHDKPRKNDKHYSHDNKNNKKHDDNRSNPRNNGSEHAGQNRPMQSQNQVNTRPIKPIRAPEQYKTPSVPVGNNPYVGAKPVNPPNNKDSIDSDKVERFRTRNKDLRIPRYEVSERPVQQNVTDENSKKYHGVPTYTVQQPAYSREGMPEQPERQIRKREDMNQHYGAPDTPQQRAPVRTDRQNSYNRYDQNKTANPQQTPQADRQAPSQYNVDTAQRQQALPQQQVQQQAQPSQAKQQRVSKTERRESKKSNIEHED